MTDVLAFTINGRHEKAERSVDPIRHWQMLLASIEAANPNSINPVVVAANNISEWEMCQAERDLYWEVCKKASIVTAFENRHGHYHGACWAPRLATEAGAAIGGDRLLFLAEDILLNSSATEILDAMGDADCIAAPWAGWDAPSVQMFGCRLSTFANGGRFVFEPPFETCGELYLRRRMIDLGLEWKRSDVCYFHCHDPDTYLDEAARRGVSIRSVEEEADREAFAGLYWYERIGHFGSREMELIADGTIGVGAGDGERYWRVRRRGHEFRLSILDNNKELICELVDSAHRIWRGRWVRYERMEISLSRVN